MRSIPYFFTQGLKSFFRNGVMTFASAFILVICMLVLGSSFLVYQNIQMFLSDTDELYILKANIADTVTDDDIDGLKQKIESFENVKECRFVSAEEAFEKLKGGASSSSPLLDEELSPLLAQKQTQMGRSFEITFEDPDKIEKLVYEVQHTEGIEKTRERLDVYNSASKLKKTLTIVCFWIMLALIIVSILVIMNTVRLTIFARRDEIAIMRYLGATGRFISAPFFVEGMLIGVVASAIAFGIQYYLYVFIVKDSLKDYFSQSLVSFSSNAVYLICAFLAVGLFAGIIATFVSIKRYLKA